MKGEILNSLSLHLQTLHDLIGDLDDAHMVQQPPGVPNHPAWTVGHIVHSFQAIGEDLRLEPWLPADWAGRFKTGSLPAAEAGAYPTKQELLDRLADGERRVRARLGVGRCRAEWPVSDRTVSRHVPDARTRPGARARRPYGRPRGAARGLAPRDGPAAGDHHHLGAPRDTDYPQPSGRHVQRHSLASRSAARQIRFTDGDCASIP